MLSLLLWLYSNSLRMFAELKTASLLQKLRTNNPTTLDAHAVPSPKLQSHTQLSIAPLSTHASRMQHKSLLLQSLHDTLCQYFSCAVLSSL